MDVQYSWIVLYLVFLCITFLMLKHFNLMYISCIKFYCFCYLTRKYRPLHMQSMTFPTLWYSGRFSPFESPPPLFEKLTEQGEDKTRFVNLPLFEGYRPSFY